MSYELPKYTVAELARLQELCLPDNQNSPGASFLTSVYDSVAEYAEDGGQAHVEDLAGEIADQAVPTYFVEQLDVIRDLQLWHAPVNEIGEPNTLADAMAYALYETAFQLAHTLASKVEEREDVPW